MNKHLKEMTVESSKSAKQLSGSSFKENNTDISLQETLEALEEKWMLYNLNVELAITEGKRIIHSKEHRKIQDYALSSANRRKFMMYLIRSTAEGDKLTVTEATKLLGIARNSVETMVKECSENGWITITRCKKKHKHMTANDNIMDCYRGYSRWLWKQVHETGLRSISEDIARVLYLQGSVSNN